MVVAHITDVYFHNNLLQYQNTTQLFDIFRPMHTLGVLNSRSTNFHAVKMRKLKENAQKLAENNKIDRKIVENGLKLTKFRRVREFMYSAHYILHEL